VSDLAPGSRELLVRLARASIEAHLAGHDRPPADPAPDGLDPELRENRGAFVTLRRRADGHLRGCVGRVESDESLVETVARMAVAAATTDPRFPAVTLAELPELQLEISALSGALAILPEDVVIGTHGLIVRFGDKSGLLLPQVAIEHRLDREAFLGWVCRKAGLPRDTWRDPACSLLGFTAVVFGEN
jgi:AmmeMemoRadiSam system protein A